MAGDECVAKHCAWQPVSRTGRSLQLMTTISRRGNVSIHAFLPAVLACEGRTPWVAPVTPDACDVYHLPNVTCELVACCFLQAALGTRSTNAIVHVLSKAWPMRCSIRNFNEIIRNYIKSSRGVYRFLLSLLHCTLAGRYSHAEHVTSFETLRRLYSYFVCDSPTAPEFAEWLTSENQQLLFIAIKEYMVFAVENVPGLRLTLEECYPWSEFVDTVIAQAESVRGMIDRNVRDGNALFNNVAARILPMRSFKSALNRTRRIQLYTSTLTIIRSACTHTMHVYNTPLRCKLQPLAADLDNDATRVMRRLSYDQDLIDCIACLSDSKITLSMRRRLCKLLEGVSFDRAFLLTEVLAACIFNMSVTAVPLPLSIRRQQEAALAERPRNTDIFACMCCRQLRAFVVDDNTASKNKWACGSNKVLLDDATGVLYCGKRIEKSGTSHRSGIVGEDTHHRNYWKHQQNMMCRYSRLLPIPMVGTLLEHFGTLYMLCPRCLCTMVLRPSRFNGGPVCCIHCQYKQSASTFSRCFHCYVECNGARVDIGGQPVMVCRSCEKPWMHEPGVAARMTRAMVHQAINERWRQGRVLVELNEHESS